jgi:UDP-N-acetylglucosamine--N-acetylmuramyl-(pentapeptide) pyrophosphoryl-undecaprenol N-acetylglucosamine transferase
MGEGVTTSRHILLAGGGTAGHVTPLLAVAEALHALDPAVEFSWLGSSRSESRLVPQFSAERGVPIDFREIDIRFSYRWPTPANWGYYRKYLLPLAFGVPFRQARRIVQQLKPDLVLASGGYVSAPALLAARGLGIPYALLQLDAVPGLVNNHFAARAWRIYVPEEDHAATFAGRTGLGRVLVSGWPARRPLSSPAQVRERYGLDPARRLLVVMGGSLGAGAVLQALRDFVQAEHEFAYAKQLAILCAVGERGELAAQLEGLRPQRLQLRLVDYIDDSVAALAAADFYLGRSGAATVAELAATGCSALLLPDPQHADRQQFHNAMLLARRGQASVLDQRRADARSVRRWLEGVWEQPRAAVPPQRGADVIAANLRTAWEAA